MNTDAATKDQGESFHGWSRGHAEIDSDFDARNVTTNLHLFRANVQQRIARGHLVFTGLQNTYAALPVIDNSR
jgi:hypothetical protein